MQSPKEDPVSHYLEMVEASSLAYRVKSWTTPVRVFGYVVVIVAGLALIVGLLAGLAGLSGNPSVALGVITSAIVVSSLLFLQGSLVLMIAFYVQMRAQETIAETSRILNEDDD